jgi:hypothetical protein
MQSARHDKRYATSGIAAHPCKERKDGATHFIVVRAEGWATRPAPPLAV